MADLPNLDTSTIGFIAYWNAHDNGTSEIDPVETTSAGFINEYTLYDNGVQGTGNLTTGRSCKFRAKEDGWLAVWIDDTEDYGTQTSADAIRGPWDINTKWETNGNNHPSITSNSLEQRVNDLYSNLSNSGDFSYASGDVGLYSYVYDNADVVSLVSVAAYDGTNKTVEYLYTSPTSIYLSAHTARTEGNYVEQNESGTRICESWDAGCIDLVGGGYMPNADTTYSTTINSASGSFVRADILTLWS